MKAIIKKVEFKKEFDSKFGKMYSFEIQYNDKKAYYTAKKIDNTNFIQGQEAEFIEEEKSVVKDGREIKYMTIKIPQQQRQSNFGKALTKEQSRYSGFAASYVKDLIVAGIIKPETDEKTEEQNDIILTTWKKRSFEIFEHLVSLDKTLEQ